jgi:hypothetical protein
MSQIIISESESEEEGAATGGGAVGHGLNFLTQSDDGTTVYSSLTPEGPSVVIIQAGFHMYNGFNTIEDPVDGRAARVYANALQALKTKGRHVAVLSLEGRKTINVQLYARWNQNVLSYFVYYGNKRGPRVNVLLPTAKQPVWRVVRRIDINDPPQDCDATGSSMKDDPEIECLFDATSHELLYTKSPRNFEFIEDVWAKAQSNPNSEDLIVSAGIELTGVLSPSVMARHKLEAEIERRVLGVHRRTLVPWPDYSHPDIATLVSYVERIVAFFQTLTPSSLAIVRCSCGLGRSGVAVMIGYLWFNPNTNNTALFEWFEKNHEAPAEAKGMWHDTPTLQAIVRIAIARARLTDALFGSDSDSESDDDEDQSASKKPRVGSSFVDLAA